jgi:hypothetical protein
MDDDGRAARRRQSVNAARKPHMVPSHHEWKRHRPPSRKLEILTLERQPSPIWLVVLSDERPTPAAVPNSTNRRAVSRRGRVCRVSSRGVLARNIGKLERSGDASSEIEFPRIHFVSENDSLASLIEKAAADRQPAVFAWLKLGAGGESTRR